MVPNSSGFVLNPACLVDDDGSQKMELICVSVLSLHFNVEASVSINVYCTAQEGQKVFDFTSKLGAMICCVDVIGKDFFCLDINCHPYTYTNGWRQFLKKRSLTWFLLLPLSI